MSCENLHFVPNLHALVRWKCAQGFGEDELEADPKRPFDLQAHVPISMMQFKAKSDTELPVGHVGYRLQLPG